ncbi:fibronectin type III domain-containing protein [Paenibacillus sp. BAC0078]
MNADTGEVVDYDSNENVYYASGGEKRTSTPKAEGTGELAAPGAMGNVTAAAASNSVLLSWPYADRAMSYEIEENGSIVASSSSSAFTRSGLTPNTEYTYRVRSVNPAGKSDWSSPITVKTLLSVPVVTALSKSSEISLNWDAVANAESYEVEYDGVAVNVGAQTSYTLTGLEPSTEHTYKVRALSSGNASVWSTLTKKFTTPVIPANVTVNPTSSTLAVAWTGVTGATGYDVEINGAVSGSSATTSYSKTALAANTDYTVRVRAKNTGGTGEWSAPVTVKTLLVTPAPTLVSTSSQVTVSWAAITGATEYEIEVDGTVVDNGAELSYTHSGLTSSTSHTYKVRALSADNASAWSAAVSKFTTPAAVGPVTVTPAASSLAATWTAVTGATGYDVEINGTVAGSVAAASFSKTGLVANTEYTVRVRAKNAGGAGEYSAPVKLKTLLATPTATAVSTSNQVTVSWAAIAGATEYEIDVDGAVVDNGTELSYTHSGLTPSTSHTYKVRAKSEDNASAWSAAVTKYTTPAAAGTVTVTPASTSLAVTWTAITGSTAYDVEINGTIAASPTTTSYTKTGLTPNTEYTVRIRAKNSGGIGEWGTPVKLKTLLVTPTATTVSTSNQVKVSWAAIAGATGYEIEVDGTVVDNGTELSYTHSGLTPSTSHTYKVRALSADNASAWSAAVSKFTTPAAVGPVTLTPTSTSLAASWTAVTGATGYDVEINGSVAGSVATTSFSKTGLVANTEYTVRVRAKNTGGAGEYSAPVTMKTLLVTPAPTTVSTSNQVTVSWAAIAGATGYEIEVDGTVVDNGTELSYTHSGLTPSTSHTYKVRALSADNASAWSVAVSKFTTPVAVGAVTVTPTATSLAATWTAVTGATGYDVEINGAVAGSVATTSFSKTGLVANTGYTVRVRAKNTGGVGEYSAPVTMKTLLVTPAPTTVSTSNQVTVSWAAIAGATGYEIEVDGTVVDNGTELSYTHSGLTASTSHTYKVRALSADNTSAWSAAVSKFTTPAAVGPVTVTPTASSLAASWTAVTGATGYDVEINGAVAGSVATTSFTKTALAANTEYTVRVRAKNAGGVGEYSAPVTLKTLLVTPTPTTVSTSNQVTVSWAAIAGATGYEIDVDGTVVDNGTELSYTHKGLTPSTSHTYKVRALSADNASAWSAAVSKYTTPTTVGPVTVTPTASSVAASWTAVTGATGYDVEINGAVAGSVATTSFTKTALAANTEYTVRVRAKNTGGAGEYSTPVMLKTLLVTPTPTTVSTSSQVTVSWAAIAGATGYEIDVDGKVVDNGTELSYTHKGLTPSTSHTYKVRALSADNASAWSAAVNKYTTPTTVGPVTVTPTSSSVAASWTAVTGATGYDVEINGAVAGSVATTSFTKTALAANTEYTVRVRAKNTGGAGEYSAPVTLKTLLVTPTPTTVSTSNQVTVSWAAIAGATGYEIDVDGKVVDNGTELSYTHSGLTPSTSHTYKVRALSGDNASAWSSAVSKYTTPTTVGPVTLTPTSSSLAASWTAVTGATGYDVEINGAVAGSSTTASFTKTALAANTEYTLRVRAKNTGGAGEYSAPVTLKTLLVTPTATTVSTSNQITVSWAAIAGATGYEIDVDGNVVDNGTELSYTHSGLTPSTSHTYKVRAKSEDNASAWSVAVSKYTTPAAVGPVALTPTASSLAASWTAVTGATGYDVEFNGTVAGSVTAASFSKAGLVANTEYTVRVRAKNSGGVGEYSAPVTLKTLLATPTATTVSTSNQVTVSWAAVAGATGYEIDVDGNVVDNGTELSYTHSGLTPSTSHTYKVRAKSEDNASAWSAAVSKYTTPAAVGPVTVTSTFSSLAASWTAVPGATGYDVEINGAIAGSVTTTSFSKAGLAANAEYAVRVRAKNSGGLGDWGNATSVKTLLATPAASAVATNNQITVSWGTVAGAAGYEIEVDGAVVDAGAATSYTHSDLLPKTTHTYRVRAKSPDNSSAWSTVVSKQTLS